MSESCRRRYAGGRSAHPVFGMTTVCPYATCPNRKNGRSANRNNQTLHACLLQQKRSQHASVTALYRRLFDPLRCSCRHSPVRGMFASRIGPPTNAAYSNSLLIVSIWVKSMLVKYASHRGLMLWINSASCLHAGMLGARRWCDDFANSCARTTAA